MDRVTVLNDVPGTHSWRGAIEEELRRALGSYSGPWTVRIRPAESWQGGGDAWSVEVARPGHVWTLRVMGAHQEPGELARHIFDAVQPDRFGSNGGGGTAN